MSLRPRGLEPDEAARMQNVYDLNTYLATVTKVVDGDTLWLNVDLGLRTHTEAEVRLLGVDAPDWEDKEARAASKAWLTERLPVGTEVILKTKKYKRRRGEQKEKYGRWLGEVWVSPQSWDDDEESINVAIIQAGHAKPAPW